MPSRNDRPPDIWDTHGIWGNVLINPPASSSSPYQGGFNPWISNVTEPISPHVTSERQTPDTTLDPRCQSGLSARNSVVPSEGGSSKNYGTDQQQCRFRIFILTNSKTQQRSLGGRYDSRLRYVLVHNFLRKLCCGSKKWSWLIQWMISNLRAL